MKYFKYIALLSVVAIVSLGFTNSTQKDVAKVNWLTWEEAAKLNETTPKKIFVDVYTDWCGWCKVMDKKIEFNGQSFTFHEVEGSRRGGIHMLAYSLLEGKMSYPTVVTLNERFERIAISPGYKEAPMMYTELQFAAEEHYKNTSFQEFMASQKSK